MDEDQDEPINRSATLGKAQRKQEVISIFSDEEESSSEDGDEVDEGDTDDDDDGEGAEDDDLEDEEDDDEEEEEEEEDDDEADGADEGMDTEKPGSGGKWASGSDEEGENCPICLNAFRDQAIGTPESCVHYFCLDCILEWAKNANSCPVDRITFKHICVRTHFGGSVLKKLPVQNPNKDNEEGQEDVTNCEVCGRSDREDSLLLCDGCDAGYHLDCLTPALHTVPVEEWFCPECAISNPTSAVEEIDDEELAFLVADAPQEPTTSRLRPTARRTRAIARTRQSERVRANVNRSRITRAHQIRDVPQYLMNTSLLDETIESVVAGLNTAVYHRPLGPRVRSTKKRRKGTGKKRKRAGRQKPRSRASLSSGTKVGEKATRKHRRKARRKKGAKKVTKPSITARSRIAKSLGLGKPVNGISVPSVYKPLEPSLKVMRTDIGAASLSVYGDPNDLDPFESAAEPTYDDTTNLGSPLSNKRRILSRSALRSHRPVARPISVKIASNGRLPAVAQEAEPEAVPVPDVLANILAEQNVLLMDSSNIVINRDGSLKAKVALGQRMPFPSGSSRTDETSSGCSSTSAHNSGNSTSAPKEDWKTAGFTTTKKSASTTFPSTSDFPSNPRQQVASSNLRPAFSGTFTPMPEVSTGPRPGESVSFSATQWTGQPSKSAGDNQKGTSGFTPFRWLNSASNLHTKNNVGTLNRVPLKPAPRRLDISEFPRIPKIKSQAGSNTQDNGIAGIHRLVGSHQNSQAAGSTALEKSVERPFQERLTFSLASSSANSSSIFQGKLGAQDAVPSSSAQSCIKVMSGTDHSARLPKLDAYDPFEPTDDEIQHCGKKGSNSPSQPNVKSADDIYDPFEPTGSDPSSSNSTPDRNESRSEGQSPASSPGNGVSVGDEQKDETLSLYFDSDAAHLPYTQQTEPCEIKAEARGTENPAEGPESHDSFAVPSLDSDLEASCDSRVTAEAKDMKLSAESSVSKWDNMHRNQSFPMSEGGHKSEQQAVNADSDDISSCACSDEGTLKAVNKTVPTSMRTDVDISSENDLRNRADKKVHTESKVRSRSRSSSRSRRRSKNLVRESRGGYRSRTRSKERKKLRSHSKEQRRSKSRSQSRSSGSDRYRRRKVKQERCREKRGRRSRSRSRERRSCSSSSDVSTDSRKRRRKVSGSKDHKGSYKHSRSSSEKGRRRQYRREQSREQYERRSRRSTSWSRERRRSRSSSRSRDKKRPWPKFREKTRSWSRSSSRERRSRSRSSSRDKRRSRTRSSSREKRRSSRYREKRRSRTRSRSKERWKPRTRSRTRSRSRDQSRSRSRERGSQSKWQAPEVERRRIFSQEKVISGEKDQEQKKASPSTKPEFSERDASVQELITSCSAGSPQGVNDLPVDQTSSHPVVLKEESIAHSDKVREEAKQMELPEQSKEPSYQNENLGENHVDIFASVDCVWEGSGTQTRQAAMETKSQSVCSEYFRMRSPGYQEHAVTDQVSIPLIGLSTEEESVPLTVNEDALRPQAESFPLPVPAAPFAGADTLNSVKPATPIGVKPATPVGVKPATPVGVKPATPVGVKPATPVGVKHATPVDVKPATPVDVKPATLVAVKPATLVGVKPATSVGVNPLMSVDIKPVTSVGVKPVTPVDVIPVTPVDVTTMTPVDVTTMTPVDVKPATPVGVKPATPVGVKPTISVGVKPLMSVDIKPIIPVDVKPVTSVGVKPVTPVDVKPATPVDVKPLTPVDIKPVTPVDIKPVTPVDIKPVTSVGVKPVMSVDIKPMTLVAVKPAKPVDDQKESVGISTTEQLHHSVPPSTEAVTSFKSEQAESFATGVCLQKKGPKPETVCLASNSITKQEEIRIDVVRNESLEKRLGSVKTESSKECGVIPLLQSTDPVKIKTETEPASQNTAVKAKPLVKRVTWNLETEKDEAPSGRPARTPMSYRTHRYNKESSWKPPETSQPSNQVPFFQPPAPNYMIPPPIFPGLFPPQGFNQLNMPPPFMPPFPPLHPPPYAPVSQPAPPYIMQGNIPLIGSTPVPPLLPQPTYQAGTVAAPAPAPAPAPVPAPVPVPAPAPETPISQVEGNVDADNKPCEDRTQNENYIKKLHVQERAVEEAKLALKPYYQNKDITKEEYKEILRKAVQKICHSKSGEINPVKVANLVKGYVEKYKHIRKYKKGAEGEASKETDAKAEES